MEDLVRILQQEMVNKIPEIQHLPEFNEVFKSAITIVSEAQINACKRQFKLELNKPVDTRPTACLVLDLFTGVLYAVLEEDDYRDLLSPQARAGLLSSEETF